MKKKTSLLAILSLILCCTMSACGIKQASNPTEASESVRESTENKEEPQVDSVSLVMVGDVLLHDPVNESGKMNDGTYNYDHLFANVKDDIAAADIAVANQEVILGGTGMGLQGYPTFNGAFEVGDAESKAGFDVILHATNHAMDQGTRGIRNCINFWKTSHPDMTVVGINDSQEARDTIAVVERNNISIAFLNYTYGTNGITVPADQPYLVNTLDEAKVISDIEAARAVADFVVVFPHWGTEYNHGISSMQKKWTDIFLQNGVDLVIGTHPHVIEPVEMLSDEAGHQMLVYYSLGNFINATSGSGAGTADRMVGAMAQITIQRQPDGSVGISDYGVEPLVTQMLSGPQQITTYKLEDYTQELADANEVVKRDSNFSLEYCKNLCQQVFGGLFVY